MFWKRFGVKGHELDDWPLKKITDYLMIMSVEAQVMAGPRDASTGSSSPDQLEIAYRAMRDRDGVTP